MKARNKILYAVRVLQSAEDKGAENETKLSLKTLELEWSLPNMARYVHV